VSNKHSIQNYDPGKTSYTPSPSHNHTVFYKLLQDLVLKNHD